jgi:hypothetical protein
VHSSPYIFAANSRQTDTSSYQIIALNKGCRTGFIDSLPNCGGPFVNAHAQRI